MATMTTTVFLFVLAVWVVGNVDSATPHTAPAPAVDCSSVVLSMVDCLSFVTAGSTVNKPEGTCCSGLKTVLKSNPECLCETFKNSAQFGVSLNMTKAKTLPSACHVSAPSVSNCGLSLAAAGAAPSPAVAQTHAGAPSTTVGAPTSVTGVHEFAPTPAPAASSSALLIASATVGSLLVALVAASFSFI